MKLDLSAQFDQLRRIGEYSAYLECLKIVDEGLPDKDTPSRSYDEGQRMALYIHREIVAKLKTIVLPGVKIDDKY